VGELELQPVVVVVVVLVVSRQRLVSRCDGGTQIRKSEASTRNGPMHRTQTPVKAPTHSLCNLRLQRLHVGGTTARVPQSAHLTQELLAIGPLVAILCLQALLGPLWGFEGRCR